MKSTKVINELYSLLKEQGYTEPSPALSSLLALESATSPDYTIHRARALSETSEMLNSLLKLPRNSYSDKAYVLQVVAPNYLKLVHAFKTDASLWSSAQADLVPALLSTSTEDDIDLSLSLLESHLARYMASLATWLSRE